MYIQEDIDAVNYDKLPDDASMSEIKNEFFDLLDMAEDTSKEFDLENNTREYLLKELAIDEGKSALAKAEINIKIYDKLESYGE